MRSLTFTAAAVVGFTAMAQAQGFDPRTNCAQIFASADAEAQTMIAAWTFGYLAAASNNVRPVDTNNNAVIVQNIAKACNANPARSLLDIVVASAPKSAPAAALQPVVQTEPGSQAEARALLEAFVKPGADHRALTQAILPSEADVKMLYADPLGSTLWNSLAAQLTPDVAFVPKPNQSEVLVVYTTTRALFDRQPVLNEFPGGYKDVLPYFKIDVPIVRFKFVEPGKTSGYAFDGLVYLQGRWVVVPKPWRALPE